MTQILIDELRNTTVFIPKILIGGEFHTATELTPLDVINPCITWY